MLEKIIFYLEYAKSKLDKNCIKHQKAKNEINEIIKKLKGSDKTNERDEKNGI